MKKSTELRQERQAHIDAQKTIVEGAKDEQGAKRSLNADETEKFRTAQKEIERLNGEIEIAEQFEANQRAAAATAGAPMGNSEDRELNKVKKRFSLFRAISSQMPNGVLDGAELEIHQETKQRAAAAGVSINGIAIPQGISRADGQTVTQDSGAYGANLVGEDLRSPIEFLRPNPVLRQLGATYLTGLQGDVAFPTNDGGIAATWEGEVDTVASTKNAYDKKTMKPKRLAANVLVSLQNIIQSSIDLERYTIAEINAIVANKIDETGINGSGTGDIPKGILNDADISTIAVGTNGGAPTWNHIVEMETKIYDSNAEGSRMSYLINSGTKGRLKTTKHTAGDLAYLMGMDNTINGYNVGVSNLVPNDLTKGSGTALNAAIFGDFSQFLIGQWGFYDMVVDNITRKKDGYVEITLNTFLDMLVRQPKAFAAIKDWSLA